MARGAGGYPPRAPAPKKRNSAARQAFFNVAAMFVGRHRLAGGRYSIRFTRTGRPFRWRGAVELNSTSKASCSGLWVWGWISPSANVQKNSFKFNSIVSSRLPICRLVTISTDTIRETNEYRTGVGAHWPFLSDAGRIVQKDLDIAQYTDPAHNPTIPLVIVLEPGLVIYKIYNGYWFFGRPTLEELRQDLRAVTKKCRPDWDITLTELRPAWQQGRKELFYPYGKTYLQTLGEQD